MPRTCFLIEGSFPRNILQAVNWHPWNWMWHPKWCLLGRKLDRHPSREITAPLYALPSTMLEQRMGASNLCTIVLDHRPHQWAQIDLNCLGWSYWKREHQGKQVFVFRFFLILWKVIQCHWILFSLGPASGPTWRNPWVKRSWLSLSMVGQNSQKTAAPTAQC